MISGRFHKNCKSKISRKCDFQPIKSLEITLTINLRLTIICEIDPRVDGQHLVQNDGGQLNPNYDAEGVKQEGQCLSQEKEGHYTNVHEWESPISCQTLRREF